MSGLERLGCALTWRARAPVARLMGARRVKGYAMSLLRRKMIEEAFGWIKTVGGLRKARHKGGAEPSGRAVFPFATNNLTRLLNLVWPKAA